jgi:putative transposase
MLKIFLQYKLEEQGKKLVSIDKWYPSSKLCSFFKHENKKLTLTDRNWTWLVGVCPQKNMHDLQM